MNKFSSLCAWGDKSCQERSGIADISKFYKGLWLKLEIAAGIL